MLFSRDERRKVANGSDVGTDVVSDRVNKGSRRQLRPRHVMLGSAAVVIVALGVSQTLSASNGGPASKAVAPTTASALKSTPHSSLRNTAPATAFGPVVLGITFPTASRGFASVFSCGLQRCSIDVEATVDSGAAWKRVAIGANPVDVLANALPYVMGATKSDLLFANGTDGLLALADPSGVRVTHDAGRTWTRVRVPGVVVQTSLLGGDFLLSIDNNSKCQPGFAGPACTPDEIVTLPVRGGVIGVVRRLPSCVGSNVVSVDSSLVLSGCGALYESGNAGATWKRLPFPSSPPSCRCGGTLLAADTASDLWAMVPQGLEPMESQDKAIYRSLDGGATWRLVDRSQEGPAQHVGNVPVDARALMLVATSDRHAVLISWFGPNFVAASLDGGSKWMTRALPAGSGGLACVGSNQCWAAAGSSVLRTQDGGGTWRSFTFGTSSTP